MTYNRIARWPRLAERERRFSEFQRLGPDISKRSPTQALRNLGQDGVINRMAFATKPTSIVRTLTPLGRIMLAPILLVIDCAEKNYDAIRTSFAIYAAKMTG